ncbi:TraC family protein [Sutterella sp.]|uniref:TraC family protein n=1 Tax=Sutterella sp. TaxID=1981025 RepID=UPI003FD789F5
MDVLKLKRFTDEGLLTDDLRAEQMISPLAVDVDHRIYMCDDNTLAFAFECQPLTGGGEKEHEKLDQLFSQNFPANMTMSFLLFRSPDIEENLILAERMRLNHRHPLLTPVFEERMNWMRRHTKEEIVGQALNGAVFNVGRIVDLKLIISVKIPFTGEEPSESDMEDVIDWATKIISSLKSIGLAPYQMDADRYVRFMNVFLNWAPNATWRQGYRPLWERDKPIPPQCFDPETGVCLAHPDYFQLGDKYVKVLSAKKMPEAMYFGNAIDYVGDLHGGNAGIHQNYAVCCNVIFPDVSKMKATLEKKRTWANNQAFGPLLKFDPILGDIKRSFDTIYDSLNNGSRPLKVSFHVIAFGDSEKEVTATASAVASFWSDQHFTIKEDRYVMVPIFKNCLPMCCDRFAVNELWRYKTMTSHEAPVILPLFGESKGTGTPHVELISRNGQVMSLSLHDSSTNQNGVIAAESGSGKSFLLNELILSYMSEGARVWVIDAGKSYKKLCESLNGDFVEFSERSRVSLNPFETIVNWNDEEDAIVNLVATMASMEGKLDDYQIAALKSHMHDLWLVCYEEGKKQVQDKLDAITENYAIQIQNVQNGVSDRKKADQMVEDLERQRDLDLMQAMPPSTMSIDLIADRCLQDPDPRVRDVGVQLGSFTSKSSYGRFFAGHNNANFKNDLTVLELDELQGRKHLRQVVLLQLISQIQREIFLGERTRKKIVIIDEAWDLLKEGEVSVFMEHAYRKFRKYGGSAIIATQSVQDLYDNTVGKAISSNSANMYLLGQKATTLEQVRKDNQLVMDDWAFNMLKSIHTEAGVFSEIFVSVGQIQCVGRLIVSDFQKLLYSTTADDVNAIKRYQDAGLGIQDAINSVLRDRAGRRR